MLSIPLVMNNNSKLIHVYTQTVMPARPPLASALASYNIANRRRARSARCREPGLIRPETRIAHLWPKALRETLGHTLS